MPVVVGAWLVARRYRGNASGPDRIQYELHNSIFLLLLTVAASRAYVGIAKYLFGADLWYVSFLFPVRVGGPNWGLLRGLPYVIPSLLVLWRLKFVLDWIGGRRNRGVYVFLFALFFGVSFGAIQGGLQYGLTAFFHAPDHVHDAELFNGTIADFLAHDDRRHVDHEPHYLAAHFATHPPFVLALWSFFLHKLSLDWFSFFCVTVFSGMFATVYLGFRKEFGAAEAVYIVVLFLFTPALLIYGVGGDDVVSYALWVLTLCLANLGLRRQSPGIFALSLLALVAAMAMQYSSIVLLPAMFALACDADMRRLPSYIWTVKYWILSSVAFVAFFWSTVRYATGFDYLGDISLFFIWYRDHIALVKLAQGQYADVLASRLMDICDFLLLGGPAIVFPIYKRLSAARWSPAQWKVRDVALVVLFVYVIFQAPGEGETARAWGGLYAVLLFGLTAEFYARYSLEIQRRIMRYSLGWALALQIPINFVW